MQEAKKETQEPRKEHLQERDVGYVRIMNCLGNFMDRK